MIGATRDTSYHREFEGSKGGELTATVPISPDFDVDELKDS
jgi:hypothetical protein